MRVSRLCFTWRNKTENDACLPQFPTSQSYPRKQGEKQLDWLATNTDVITTQSRSLLAFSREKNHQVKNGKLLMWNISRRSKGIYHEWEKRTNEISLSAPAFVYYSVYNIKNCSITPALKVTIVYVIIIYIIPIVTINNLTNKFIWKTYIAHHQHEWMIFLSFQIP